MATIEENRKNAVRENYDEMISLYSDSMEETSFKEYVEMSIEAKGNGFYAFLFDDDTLYEKRSLTEDEEKELSDWINSL